jgi:hypothetical protein
VSDLERLIKLLTAQFRWGLHPVKVAIALLLPVAILWIADWRIRRMSRAELDRAHSRDDAAASHAVLGG